MTAEPRGFTIIADGIELGKSYEGGDPAKAIAEFKERKNWNEDTQGKLHVPLYESHPGM